jgi:hypothetical protein
LYEYLPGFFCSADPHSLSNNIVRTVYEDRTGTIRVGTMDGLNKLDRESRQFTHYQHDPDDPNSLSDNTVWSVVESIKNLLYTARYRYSGNDRLDITVKGKDPIGRIFAPSRKMVMGSKEGIRAIV